MPDTEAALAEPTAEPVAADPGADAPEAESPTPAEAETGQAKPAKDKQDKDRKDKKDKKGKDKEGAAGELPDGPSIAGHPRAVRSVAQAKAWGALIGFVLGGYLSMPTHTLADAGLRALASGAILYVAVWGVAVFVWRRLVIIEIKAREAQLLAAAQAVRVRQQGAQGAQGTRGAQGASAN